MKNPTKEDQPPQSGATLRGAVRPSSSGMFDQTQSIAGVIGVIPGEVSPEEKARARQMLNALQQVRDRSPISAAQNATPKAREHSVAASQDVKRKRVKLDDIFAPALAEVGYKKVAKLTYRGEWSTPEVEHVLTLDTSGSPKVYLGGVAGLRNPRTSAFADQCRNRYAHPVILRCLRESGYVYPPWSCPSGLPLFALTPDRFSWRLDLSAQSPSDLAQALSEFVRSKLVPLVSPVISTAAFLEFLERNEEPVLWARMGGSTQAAIVAFLARKLGIAREKTKASLITRAKLIENGIDTTRLTPETYIDHILDDAEVAVAQAAP
jgi:hypothetical protein